MSAESYKHLLKKELKIRGGSISGNIINALNKVRIPLNIAKHMTKGYLLYKDKTGVANSLGYAIDTIDKVIENQYNKKVKSGEIKAGNVNGLAFTNHLNYSAKGPLGDNDFEMIGNGYQGRIGEVILPKKNYKSKSKSSKPSKSSKSNLSGRALFFPGIAVSQQTGGGVKKKKAKGIKEIDESINNLSDMLSTNLLRGKGLALVD